MVVDRRNVLAEGNLRVRYRGETKTDSLTPLYRAVEEFLLRYSAHRGDSSIDLVISANLVLYHEEQRTFSLYYGNDMQLSSRGDLKVGRVYRVRSIGDLTKIPQSFNLEDFRESFQLIFSDTKVVVHSLASLVFILRRHTSRFSAPPKPGNQWLVETIF